MKERISDLISDFRSAPTKKKIYLILFLMLSLSIFVSATLFIVSATTIFFTGGTTPYSREVVNEHLGRMLPANIITLLLLVTVGVYSLFMEAPKPLRYPLSKKTLLSLSSKKLPKTKSASLSIAMEGEKKHRRRISVISLSASLLLAIVSLIFILNPNAYTLENVNTDIAYSVIIASVAALLGFAIWYARGVLLDASYVRETTAVREEIKANAVAAPTADEDASDMTDDELLMLSRRDGHIYSIVRISVLVISIVFIVLGVFNGGMTDVLGKAVKICTECIGLG